MYSHTFKSLAFGDVAVANPKLVILPADNFDLAPEMLIGMDIMRKLHMYFSFHEGKIYITPASIQTAEQKALQASLQPVAALRMAYKASMPANIATLDKALASNPTDARTLNSRCYWRASAKIDLDGALADCDQAIKLKPGDAQILDSRALVLYQQGRYQAAVNAYDAVLAVSPKFSESLFMRGHAKGKLGDAAGMEADIAAAKSIKPDVDNEFRPYDVDRPTMLTCSAPSGGVHANFGCGPAVVFVIEPDLSDRTNNPPHLPIPAKAISTRPLRFTPMRLSAIPPMRTRLPRAATPIWWRKTMPRPSPITLR